MLTLRRKGCDHAAAEASELMGGEFGIEDLDYELPDVLVAQTPPPRRDDSRLLVVPRLGGALQDATIRDFPCLLRAGDLLVLNDTRVLPARFIAYRPTGGKVPGLFLEEEKPSAWEVMLEGSRRLRTGESLRLGGGPDALQLTLLEPLGEGRWRARVDSSESPAAILQRVGQTPLPPYIQRKGPGVERESMDRDRYQTVYARVPGAVAAPTAGLHLTPELLQQATDRGVHIAYLTLHVGPGTFRPVSARRLTDHVMHYERYQIPESTIDEWKQCRRHGGRVVAVGTTVVRVLESVLGEGKRGELHGSTNLFIYPPYRLTAIDALLTNFHLPRSTLLALVMAFAGVERTRQVYQHAVQNHYRFYSYGDAMFIA